MRPIDADAIPWFVEGVRVIPVVTKEEVDEMPTVEAIPVEWLKKRYGTETYFKKAKAAQMIISDWEAERKEE